MTVLPSQPERSVDTAVGDAAGPTSRFQRALKWVELGVLISTVAGLISSVLYFLVAAKGLDLVVWFEKVERVYPSRETNDLVLPLVFENQPARGVTLIKVNASNLGDSAVGSQENLWQLTISAQNVSRLKLVGTLQPSSDRIVLKEIAQSTPNAYSVLLGVLERRARLEFWLMAIHDPAVRVNPDASTSLAGLPRPENTRKPLHERLGEKLLPFMIPLSAVGFLYIAVNDLRGRTRRVREARDLLKDLEDRREKQLLQGGPIADGDEVSDDHLARIRGIVERLQAGHWRRSRWETTKAVAANAAGIIFGAAMLGGFSAHGLGWIMAWFI